MLSDHVNNFRTSTWVNVVTPPTGQMLHSVGGAVGVTANCSTSFSKVFSRDLQVYQ